MSDLGAGIALNQDWDFEVDTTGDLRMTTGLAELQKDIAFNVADSLQSELGRRIDNTTAKRISVIVQNQLVEDPRVVAVGNTTVRRVDNTNEFEVVAEADTVDGPFELVFEVDV
jgi:hypothetical protein